MIIAYENLNERNKDYDLSERAFTALGYRVMRLGKIDEAIYVFDQNTKLYPKSANTFDSLGEAYHSAGRINDAILSYEHALNPQPDMPSATATLEKLHAKSKD